MLPALPAFPAVLRPRAIFMARGTGGTGFTPHGRRCGAHRRRSGWSQPAGKCRGQVAAHEDAEEGAGRAGVGSPACHRRKGKQPTKEMRYGKRVSTGSCTIRSGCALQYHCHHCHEAARAAARSPGFQYALKALAHARSVFIYAASRSACGQSAAWQARTVVSESRRSHMAHCTTRPAHLSAAAGLRERPAPPSPDRGAPLVPAPSPATTAAFTADGTPPCRGALVSGSGLVWVNMNARTFASVSGQTRRPARSPRMNDQSFTAPRPKLLSAMAVCRRNVSTALRSVSDIWHVYAVLIPHVKPFVRYISPYCGILPAGAI